MTASSSSKASGALHDITPYLMYRDAEGGIAFCVAAFGAVERMRHVEGEGADRRIAHAQLQIGDALLMLSQYNPAYPDMVAIEDCAGGSPIGLFLEVEDADATVARALERGATLIYPISDQPYGRGGSVRDPFGYHWHINSQPRTAAA